ncbi:hypothetical protein [Carboxylicivirga sp. M1479]|uniref:hypothetical protein n=1 Tax=Carboxylicivirga sp. M1479 TaxID=2594476 RepID=UPI00117812AD|nr:hypothetical protein [Carboxylicivirga sp. M1479]TRX71520.1 hypothetical protein FNN09_05995 [Carboxylicivirga sp. M1479]
MIKTKEQQNKVIKAISSDYKQSNEYDIHSYYINVDGRNLPLVWYQSGNIIKYVIIHNRLDFEYMNFENYRWFIELDRVQFDIAFGDGIEEIKIATPI